MTNLLLILILITLLGAWPFIGVFALVLAGIFGLLLLLVKVSENSRTSPMIEKPRENKAGKFLHKLSGLLIKIGNLLIILLLIALIINVVIVALGFL